jgi:tRNA threonylcarbamoyladenosine biosynthesis protein TsaB
MRLIALETATEACSAALWLDGEVHWLMEREAVRRHGELILDLVDRLLANAGMVPRDLDAVAVGRGPGAFTGVRLGLGVAQGLAFAIDCPVVPVSTLAALAQQGADRGAREVLALLDARMGEVYWSLHSVDAKGQVRAAREHLSVPEAVHPEWSRGPGMSARHAPLPETGQETAQGEAVSPRMALGNALAAYPQLGQQLGLSVTMTDASALPCAREVAILGAAAHARGESVSPERAQPQYLRDQVAQSLRPAGPPSEENR